MWGPPQIRFFAYYMGGGGGLRSVSLLTIGGPLGSVYSNTIWSPPPSGRLLHLLYVGAPLDKFLRLLYGPPLRSVSLLTIWAPPPNQFLSLLCGGLFRSVSSHNILYRGPPHASFFAYLSSVFFAYYMGAPSD